jgi:hypothetical protein
MINTRLRARDYGDKAKDLKQNHQRTEERLHAPRPCVRGVFGGLACREVAAMQVLLDLDRLDGACDLRRVTIDGAGQDRLPPGGGSR